ncbi:XRE family transcriptional regulator [Streptomyces sp. NPDC059063]|uniref:XRE family transcriptional regulator n=1 Tax=Streptomyces sp. NPDC059063 TaxID=3346712 RepID=UPI0036B3E813
MANEAAKRFSTLVKHAAVKAGYDMQHGGTGRARLAEDTGMSIWAVGRMLRGDSLPDPASYQHIARAVGVPTRWLLIESGILQGEDDRGGDHADVRSVTTQPLSPEAVADMLGITAPGIREMLITTIQQAVRLQSEVDSGTDGGPAAARG